MKYLKKTAIWFLFCLYFILVYGFVSNRYNGQICNALKVNIKDSLSLRFILRSDVINMLQKNEIKYLGQPLGSIDLARIEELFYSKEIIKTCRAYKGVNGSLKIDIVQREPFVRIIDQYNQGYYFDREGKILRLSPRFAPNVLVVNGNIKTPFKTGTHVNIKTSGEGKQWKSILDIYELSSYLSGHKFWKSQIVQVYVNQQGEFELITLVGPHVILLGTIDDYKVKLDKLDIFYKEGLNKVGWNQYVKINLKYKDQIVCTKI